MSDEDEKRRTGILLLWYLTVGSRPCVGRDQGSIV